MLIKIDTSVVDFIKTNIHNLTESSDEISALNNLAISSMHGIHIVFATLPALEFLMKLELLDFSSRKIYNSIFTRFSMLGSYQSLFNSYIVVKDTNCTLKRVNNVFEVPLNYFSHILSVNPTKLLCEDISDYKLYTKLAKKYIKEHHTTYNLSLSFDFVNGGGDRSGLNYENLLIDKNQISLAIADSDKKVPHGDIGNTLKGLRSSFNRFGQNKVTDLIGLSVREKENLIPPSIYELCSNSSLDELINKLMMIESSKEHYEKLFYLDIKDGLQAKQLKNNSSQMEYYKDMFREIPELISCTVDEIDNLHDEDFIIRGIGTSLMDNFVTNVLEDGLDKQLKTKKELSSLDPIIITMLEDKIKIKDHLFNNIPDFIKPHIVEICETIIAWGCSTSQPNSIAG
ncbi:hypothetical protein ACWM35_10180 [Neobacillus sp. K501]